jgi:hypothetical protein
MARGLTGVFTVEENDGGYQAVYPVELSDLGAVYGTEIEAWNAIKVDCMDRGIVAVPDMRQPEPSQTSRSEAESEQEMERRLR